MPSDPNTGKARKNNKSPAVVPDVLPRDYNPRATPVREEYNILQPRLIDKFDSQ